MSERKSSSAKEVRLESYEDSPLDKDGVVSSHFEHARDPELSKMHLQIDEERKEEAAKAEVEADKGSFLDREDSLLPVYKEEAERRLGRISVEPANQSDASKAGPQDEKSGGEEGNGSGSAQVKKAGFKHEMQPPESPEVRRQNAITHYERMANDNRLSDSYRKEIWDEAAKGNNGAEDVWSSAPENSNASEKDGGYEPN